MGEARGRGRVSDVVRVLALMSVRVRRADGNLQILPAVAKATARWCAAGWAAAKAGKAWA